MSVARGAPGAELVVVFECKTGPGRDAGEGRVGERNRHARAICDQLRQAAQQRAAAGEQDALAGDVAGELGRGVFERGGDRTQDLLYRRADRLTDLRAVQLYLGRQTAE